MSDIFAVIMILLFVFAEDKANECDKAGGMLAFGKNLELFCIKVEKINQANDDKSDE